MARPSFTITYTEPRDRLSNAFRLALVLPHLAIVCALGVLAYLLALVQYVVVLLTGRRNEDIWRKQDAWLGYWARVHAYFGLMYDKWPNISDQPNGEPTIYSFEFDAAAARLGRRFRIIETIRMTVTGAALAVAVNVAMLATLVMVLATGRQPRELFDFMVRGHSYLIQQSAFWLQMTDEYPVFGE